MSAVDLFRFEGQQVRTVIVDGEPWFVARDVAAVLGYANTADAIAKHCKGVANHYPLQTAGGTQNVRVIAEPDVLRMVIASRLPAAERFERWVFEEVLPQIRRTGKYAGAEQIEFRIPQTYAAALELAALQAKELEAAEQKIAADAPKVAAFDQLMDAEGFYTMEAVAKIGGIGRTTLFRRLRDAGVIQTGSRMPFQRYMHWFKVTTTTWTDDEGSAHLSNTPRVLPSALVKVLGKAGVQIAPLDGMEQIAFGVECAR